MRPRWATHCTGPAHSMGFGHAPCAHAADWDSPRPAPARLRIDRERLAALVGESEKFQWSTLDEARACLRPALFGAEARVCPLCLAADLFALRWLQDCPIHAVPSVLECRCGRAFPMTFSDPDGRPAATPCDRLRFLPPSCATALAWCRRTWCGGSVVGVARCAHVPLVFGGGRRPTLLDPTPGFERWRSAASAIRLRTAACMRRRRRVRDRPARCGRGGVPGAVTLPASLSRLLPARGVGPMPGLRLSRHAAPSTPPRSGRGEGGSDRPALSVPLRDNGPPQAAPARRARARHQVLALPRSCRRVCRALVRRANSGSWRNAPSRYLGLRSALLRSRPACSRLHERRRHEQRQH